MHQSVAEKCISNLANHVYSKELQSVQAGKKTPHKSKKQNILKDCV